MTIYYAIGGGLGHARRARRVLDALEIHDAEIITSDDLPRTLESNRDAHRRWLVDRFRGHRVLVDTFPAGIQGELSGIEDVAFDYVARLLRWDEYCRAVPHAPPRFETTYVVEELTQEHGAFAREHSNVIRPLPLAGEGKREALGEGMPLRPYSLIVHSGPECEVEELIAYTQDLMMPRHAPCGTDNPVGPPRQEPQSKRDMKVLVATKCEISLPSGFQKLDTDNPSDLFANAQHIITAAGFNVMLETEPWRDKHHVVPFPRRFDDQFLRAARRRR